MPSQCGWFEITPNSPIAGVSTVINGLLFPQNGNVITVDLEQGQQIEVAGSHGNVGSQVQALICVTGQATGGSATALDDTNQNWPLGLFNKGSAVLAILGGTGAGKFSTITSNTDTHLVFNAVAGMSVDNSTRYAIVIDNVSGGLSGGNVGIFTPWQTGSYLIEIASPYTFGTFPQLWGRFPFLIDQSTITGPGTPMNNVVDFVYDPLRDVFWVLDSAATFPNYESWLVKIQASTGQTLSRTALPPCLGLGIGYDVGQDKLLIDISDLAFVENLLIIDPSTLAIVTLPGTFGYLMAYCPVNGLMYMSNGKVFNTATQTVVTTIATIGPNWEPFFIAADNRIWYDQPNTSPIKVVDPGTNTIVQNVVIAGGGRALTYAPTTGKVYTGYSGFPAGIGVIDPNTYTFDHFTSLPQATQIDYVAFRSQDGLVWAGTESDYGEMSNLLAIDPNSESIKIQLLGPPEIGKVVVGTNGQVAMISFPFFEPASSFTMHKP